MTNLDQEIISTFLAQKKGAVARRTSFDYAARIAALDKLRAKVLSEEEAICDAIYADFAKHPDEVMLTEILPLLLEISHTRKHLRKWMRSKRAPAGVAFLGTSARVHPTPKGTSLVIAPWNFPFLLALGPVVSALAAGCSVILKPSELTPATSVLLRRIVSETFSPDLITVVEGGVEVATELLAQPFDHIFFTGSPKVGEIVMAAASKTLASVTLELGGKSPVVVGPDANIKQAARWVAWAKCLNGGQACVATDHVYVHESVKDAFVAALTTQITKMYGPDPLQSKDLARMAHAQQWDRVAGLIDDARKKGATVVAGGQTDKATRKIAPTVLMNVREEMDLQQTEIFGPVLPVMPYRDLDPLIEKLNAAPYPLAMYVFGSDAFADKVISRTMSGSVGVNLAVFVFAHPSAPFGGVGTSGNGGAHSYAGFVAFSHMRQVLRARFFPVHILFPPFTTRTRKLLSIFKAVVRR